MRKIVFGISLFIACIATGCKSSQLHQSLLIHENRQLEDALYSTHAQIADLQRENDWLREQANDYSESPRRSRSRSWDDDLEPFEMPKVILPSETGTTEAPEWLKGSQTIHVWSPRR